MPDVSMSLQTGGKKASQDFSPNVGGAIEIGFQPGKAKFSVDYSKENSLVLSVAGEFSLKDAGTGIPLSLGAGGSIALDGSASIKGAVAWEIAKQVKAKAEVDYSGKSTSGAVTLTIRF